MYSPPYAASRVFHCPGASGDNPVCGMGDGHKMKVQQLNTNVRKMTHRVDKGTVPSKKKLPRRSLTFLEAINQARERLMEPLILLIKLYVRANATPTFAAFPLSKLKRLDSFSGITVGNFVMKAPSVSCPAEETSSIVVAGCCLICIWFSSDCLRT